MGKTICPLYSFRQAMTKVYSKCYDEIGAFNDTRYIVGMLEKVVSFALTLRDYKTVFFVALLRSCNFTSLERYWATSTSLNDILH